MREIDIIDWMEDELTSIPDDETFAWMKDAAILAQCFFCAAYHDLITKTTFYWALGKLFGKEKNTRHDLHELARFVMIELYNGAGKEIPKTIEKDPDALTCYYVEVTEVRKGAGYVYANNIEDARNFGNFAAMNNQLTMKHDSRTSCAKKVTDEKLKKQEGAVFDIVNAKLLEDISKPWREMK